MITFLFLEVLTAPKDRLATKFQHPILVAARLSEARLHLFRSV